MGREQRPDVPASVPAPKAAPASLRARLLLLGIAVLAVALGLVGVALDAAYSRSAETELRNQMETWVYLVLGATNVNRAGVIRVREDLGDPRLSQPASGIYAHVHGEEDHWNSPSSLGLELPDLAQVPAGEQVFRRVPGDPGFVAFQYGVAWELPDKSTLPFTVSVLAAADLLQQRTSAFRGGLWRWLGAAGLILALAQFLFLWLALRPLRHIAADVAAIEAGERVRLGERYPSELEPLTRNLDRLLTSEKANQERYRSALDSLAHSLKTPLAVIRAGLPKSEGPELEAMQDSVDDMQHLITSRLQRAAASARRTHAAPVAVLPMAERLLNSLRKVHSRNLRTADVSIDPGVCFHGEQRDLMELLGNLLDNACKYGEGTVRLTAGEEAGGLWITVENDGSPISPDRVDQLLQRGERGDERERVEGHGLGLTIVSEIVNTYGGEFLIGESELGGAAITIRIPRA